MADYLPETSSSNIGTNSELTNLIIDFNDESCPDFDLHISAFLGDVHRLKGLLCKKEYRDNIDAKIRPYMCTPLRLASTAGHLEAVKILTENGASVDAVDKKSQTPLFVALVNQRWSCAEYLLSSGSNPNGDDRNLCSPLSIMAQRGYYEGVKLLCSWGVNTEDFYRLLSSLPSAPLTISATYKHCKVFCLLLLYGARPDLGLNDEWISSNQSSPNNVEEIAFTYRQILKRCSIPHTIIKHSCPPEFVYLYYEFGGNLWIRDSNGLLATEINEKAPAVDLMHKLQETPLSLQSWCRLKIWHQLRRNPNEVKSLPLNSKLINFIKFAEIANSVNQMPLIENANEIFCRTNDILQQVVEDFSMMKIRSKLKITPPNDWILLKEQPVKVVRKPESEANESNIPTPPPPPPKSYNPMLIKLPRGSSFFN